MTGPLQLDDVAQRTWSVEIVDAQVRFRAADGADTCVVAEKEIDKRVGLMASVTSALMLRLTTDERKIMFRLDDDKFIALGGALGKHNITHLAVRSFTWIAILVGVLWVLGSMPIAGVPEDGIDAVPLGVFKLVSGLVILGAGVASRFVAHRSIVLIDALWCIAAACDGAVDILNGVSSPWWGIASAALAGLALGQLRMYRLLGRVA